MKIYVANIGGKDETIDYGLPENLCPQDGIHPPINYHAFAAATGGVFLSKVKDLGDNNLSDDVAIVLLRRNLAAVSKILPLFKERFGQVYVAWKECGHFQTGGALVSNAMIAQFANVQELADGLVFSSLDPPPFVAGNCRRLLTPYPVDLEEWNRSVPIKEREGIFCGTREWFVPGRCHGLGLTSSLSIASKTKSFVTVVNSDGRRGSKMYEAAFGGAIASGALRVVDGCLPYPKYLDLMARHRMVFQWDRSGVPGQVAGDALLCRSVCVGGNSAIEGEIFGHFLGGNEASAYTEKLLNDDCFYESQIADSQELAMKQLSFAAFRKRIAEAFA